MHTMRIYIWRLAVALPVSLAVAWATPAAATGTASLVLTASSTRPVLGQRVTVTAKLTVTGNSTSSLGLYTIYDGTKALISGAMPDIQGGYAYMTSSLSVGTHTLSATYAGLYNGLSATSNSVTVQVSAGTLSITTTSLAAATVGTVYSATFKASGGTTPYTWSIASGSSAPSGLTLSTSGTLSGTPATASGSLGTGFKVQVKDSSKTVQTATTTLSLKIAPDPLSITTKSLATGTVGTAYTAQLASSGGTGTVTWKLAKGSSLVAGVTLSSAGAISGKPTAPTNGAGRFSVVATDSASTKHTATAQIAYTIDPAVAHCTADGSGNAKLKGGYAFQFSEIFLDYDNAQVFLLGAFTADGKGAISGGVYDTNSPASDKAYETGSFTGTYAVGADDRGVLTVSVPKSSGSNQTYSYCMALDSFSDGVAGGGRMVEDDASGRVSSGSFYGQGGSDFALSDAKGSWVFGAQGGQDSSDGQVGRAAVAGFLTLNGKGKLTSGQTDVSVDGYKSGVLSNNFIHQTGLTGSYTLAPSGRGTLAILVPPDEPGGGTSHMVFYVAGPNQFLMMNTDPGGEDGAPILAGNAYLRATTTFNNATFNGTAVFVANGISNTNSTRYDQRKVRAGIMSADGKGNMTMSEDTNDAGDVTLAAGSTESGTYSVDANGRIGGNPAIYLVGPNQAFAVGGNLGVYFSYIEKQTVPTGGFKLSSFDGDYSTGTFWYGFAQQNATSGVGTANGAGTFLGTVDLNKDGNVTVGEAYNETYTAAASGRFVLKNGSQPWAALYMVSPTKGYTIDISGKEWEPLQVFNHQ